MKCISLGRAFAALGMMAMLMVMLISCQPAPACPPNAIGPSIESTTVRQTTVQHVPVTVQRQRTIIEEVPTVLAVPTATTYSMQSSSYMMRGMSAGYGSGMMMAPRAAVRRGVGLGILLGRR